jgi:hypothetical protein
MKKSRVSLTIRNTTVRSLPKIVAHRCDVLHDLQNSKIKLCYISKTDQLNILCDAENFGKILSSFGQQEIQYTE